MLAFVLLISMIFVSNYNSVVRLEEEINESSGNIEVSQKRRMDLIPNYVDSVQDYKKFEKETLEEKDLKIIMETGSLEGVCEIKEANSEEKETSTTEEVKNAEVVEEKQADAVAKEPAISTTEKI